ncbi:MAG: hypothetical protein RL017_204 [Pseudomonadota bacterium]|jgi:PAT family beta-lactamase induction signal transducer AmpG
MDKINIRPWRWVPTTYFMQGLPFSLIVIVSTIMYKNFKLNNSDITFYTGWFFIPWIVKPIWAWFIDLYQTKRWWIFLMEILLGVGFFTIAMSLQFSNYFIISLALFWLCAFFSASHDIATDGFYLITLKDDQQSFFVGMQSLFSQAARFFAGGLLVMLSGILIQHYALSPYLSWSICFIIAAVVALCIGLYNFFVLPRCEIKHQQPKNNLLEIKTIFIDFFKLKQIWLTLLFIMTFRLCENMVLKIIPLFILDSRTNGGLGFDNTYLGISNIFILLAMVTAGVLGGLCINRFGLKKCIIPMIFCVNIPHIIYIYLASAQPQHQILVMTLQVLEYFATTFSLTAYTMTVYHLVRDSKHKTAHFAFVTGIMVLSIMFPSMFSGALQQYLGYIQYFSIVMLTIIPSLILVSFLHIEENFGKKINTPIE